MSPDRLWLPLTGTTARPGAAGGIPNGSLSPCTISTGTVTASSSSQAGLFRTPRRMQRERQAQHGDGARVRGRPAGHASPGRSPADDQPAGDQPAAAQIRHHGVPCRVELGGRGLAAPARHAIGLFDEHHAQPGGHRDVGRGHEVTSTDPAAGAVAEDERPGRAALAVDVGPRGPVRRVDRELGHSPEGRRDG